MSAQVLNGIGGEVAVASAISPNTVAAGTVTSAAIDRMAGGIVKNSGVLVAETGTSTGTPDSYTVDTKVQHCDTSGGSYADWKPDGTAASGACDTLTADDKRARKSIDFRGAKQFVKVVQVTAFVNGTTPKVGAAAQLVLGSADTLPAESDGTA